MKKLLFTLSALCIAAVSYGQQNVVKIGIGSILQSDLHLKYERAFAEKHSFQLGVVADFNERTNLANNFFVNAIGLGLDDPLEVKLGGFAVVPEYRYYFSNAGSPRGFYAGVYGRYRQRNLEFLNDFGTGIEFEATGRLWNVGIGLGIGAQFLISDKIAIDWYIGGLGYNRFFASAEVAPRSPEDFDQLKSELTEELDGFNYSTISGIEEVISEDDFNSVKDLNF